MPIQRYSGCQSKFNLDVNSEALLDANSDANSDVNLDDYSDAHLYANSDVNLDDDSELIPDVNPMSI